MDDSAQFNALLTAYMNEQPKINDAAKNLLAELLAINATQGTYDAAQLLPAIQKVLKSLKTVVLLDPVAWGRANPQGQAEKATERMDAIMRYKAAYLLWKRVTTKGESPGKLLGKSFLQQTWQQVKENMGPTDANDTLVYVVSAFENSLAPARPEVDVVWSNNMHETIGVRHKERKEKAAVRAQEAAEAEHELRHAVIEQLPTEDDEHQN
jgi:hypothetical protein